MRKTLVLALLAAPALADETDAAFEKLKAEFEAAQKEFYRPAEEAEAAGKEVELDWSKEPSGAFATKFAAFAKEHPKTEGAAKALVMVVHMTRDEDERAAAMKTLLGDHRDSEAMKDVVYGLEPDDLKALAEKSPHAAVKGYALLRLGELHVEAGEEKEAITLFREVKEKYGDIPWFEGTVGERAEGSIFALEKLGIGKPAPEIEGVDLDGKPMKLSDFKGKVVVLDFWGDW